mmetsp:Transcript_42405/g.40654  ORF Transcript_42405/g.40654 Transcript_42405/m.40654 type:complete len:120 (+) Transcript_42405:283-642(+)
MREEISRNLQAANFNYKNTYTNILNSMEWKRQIFPLRFNPRVEDALNCGLFEVYGRDKHFRPLIIINAIQFTKMRPQPTIDDSILACCLVQEYVIKHFMIKGQIESWMVIIDFGNMSLF